MKTISCKLDNPTVDRLTAVVEAQGTTKAQVLKHLVLQYLDSDDEVEVQISTGTPRSSASVATRLPSEKTHSGDYLPHGRSSSLDTLSGQASYRADLPSGSQSPVEHQESTDSSKFVKGSPLGWLLLGLLVWKGLRSTSSVTVDRKPLLGLR